MAYKVKSGDFEGSVELLLELVKKSEVDVYEVWISEITNQYLQHLSLVQEMDLDEALEFLVIAASLVYLKSRSLLPSEAPVSEDEVKETPESLEKQVREYERYKQIARHLKEKAEVRSQHYTHPVPEALKKEEFVEATLYDLVSAFKGILEALPKKEEVREIEREVITVEDRIEEIINMFTSAAVLKFSEIFKGSSTRMVIVVSFLALLELIRLRKVRAVQSKLFAEIELIKI